MAVFPSGCPVFTVGSPSNSDSTNYLVPGVISEDDLPE